MRRLIHPRSDQAGLPESRSEGRARRSPGHRSEGRAPQAPSRGSRHCLTAVLILLQVLCLAACTTKSKAKLEASEAFSAGQSQALKQLQAHEPVVTVLGQVRNHTLPWQEGLTLAQAIDAAVYTGFTDPRLIRLTRGTEATEIKVRDLLRGAANPTVEAGDVIEVIR